MADMSLYQVRQKITPTSPVVFSEDGDMDYERTGHKNSKG